MKIDKTFGIRDDSKEYYDRIGAYLIAAQDNKIAVVETPKGCFLLGGKIEENENHIDCIKRECLEEIGCSVIVDDYICSAEAYCVHDKIGYSHPVQYYYSGKIVQKLKAPIENDHKLKWLELEKAETELVVEQQIWAVRKFISNLL